MKEYAFSVTLYLGGVEAFSEYALSAKRALSGYALSGISVFRNTRFQEYALSEIRAFRNTRFEEYALSRIRAFRNTRFQNTRFQEYAL